MLGCNVINLLKSRIKIGIDFALNERNSEVDWFLSGGIKNPNESSPELLKSEAYKMSQMISNSDDFVYGSESKSEWNYILDEASTNTAENFIMLKKMLEANQGKYSKVYVVTSDFHFKRAEMFANKIIENNKFNWILSDLELHDSRYWETVHIRNVDNDINKALSKKL
jgi:uncharacterized SAM-binding protein YcdF (DUF218 family)